MATERNQRQPRASRQKNWLNSTDTAEEIGVHPSTLADWREARKGPPFQRYENGTIRYHRNDIAEYLKRTRYAGNGGA